MKTITLILLMILVNLYAFSYNIANKSNEAQEIQYGFSARLEGGFLLLLVSSNAYPNPYSIEEEFEIEYEDETLHINNKEIESLSQDPDPSLGIIANNIMFDVNYLFSNGLELYIGTPFYDNDRQGLTFGAAKTFNDDSRLDFSFFGGATYVWEDPFITGVERDRTEMFFGGTALDYDHMFGTDFEMFLRIKYLTVDDDLIGKRYSELKRDGEIKEIGLRYTVDMRAGHFLMPGISLIDSDLKGKSESYKGYKTDLTYFFEKENYSFFSSLSYEHNNYDYINPVFSSINGDNIYWFGTVYTRYNLFKISQLYARAGLGLSFLDSDIDFYDTKSVLLTFTIGYNY